MSIYELQVKRMEGQKPGTVRKVRVRASSRQEAVEKFNVQYAKHPRAMVGPVRET